MVTSTFNELVRTFLAEFPGFPCFPSHVFHRKFSIKDFFSKCNQIRSLLRIWSHLQKKFLLENFIFCAVQWHEMNWFLHRIIHCHFQIKFLHRTFSQYSQKYLLPISISIYGITKKYSIENGQFHVTTVSLFHQHRILTILKHVIKKEISGISGTLIWWKYVKSVYDVITRFIKRSI